MEYEQMELPSRGLCYPIVSQLRSGKINMKPLISKDVDLYALFVNTIQYNGDLISFLKDGLQQQIVSENIDITQLNKVDVAAILLRLQRGCANETIIPMKKNDETVLVDINQSTVVNLIDNTDNNGFLEHICNNGEKIIIRLLPFIDEYQIFTEYSNNMIEYIIRSIVSINERQNKNEIEDYIMNLKSNDIREIWNFININKPSIYVKGTQAKQDIFINYTLF